ncbi:MAG TPA: hypothetical protein VFH39_00740 [Candidatus Saccharimonadales bacterium]|nr:hypothetical protein [Candidatus Saccharimonadales bacterium]
MKFIQTDNQIEIRMAGTRQALVAAIVLSIGVALAVFGLHLPNNATTRTTVSSNGTTTTVGPHAGLIMLLFGIGFGFVGLWMLLAARSRRTIIVKNGETTLTVRRLVGGQPESKSFATSTIKAVRLNSYMSGTSGAGTRESTILLVLNDNTLVDIADKGSGGFTMNGINLAGLFRRPPLTDEANRLSQFLGMPLDASDMSSVTGALNTVRDVWLSKGDPQAKLQRIEQTFTQGLPPAEATSAVSPQPNETPPSAGQPTAAAPSGTVAADRSSDGTTGPLPPAS